MRKLHSLPLAAALPFLPLAWLWFVLVNDLRVEWTVNPQYSYGWAVPFLCAFLLWQKIQKPENRRQKAEAHPPPSIFYLLLVLCAVLYAPTRLVEEANPGWRLVSWALALEVVGITLCALRFTIYDLRFAIFPICYFLVAVPWPSLLEGTLIQSLTRLDTGITTELLGWLGIPAMPHGNVIEVATGVVGIDEACSGIRSFQATLMISLFLGEYYGLSVFRRAVLCLAGFALSFLFNLARMSLLVWVAAHKGVAAIASWHDPAGVTILVACFFCLWGMGVWLKAGAEINNQKEERRKPKPEIPMPTTLNPQLPTVRKLAMALGIWILMTEFSIEGWYRWHEARVPIAMHWTVAWPTNNPTFKEEPLAGRTRQILRYDEGRSAGWSDGNLTWQAVFLRWDPGRTALHLAEDHTPEICMTGAGRTLNVISRQEWFDVNGLRLPFSVNAVTDLPQHFYVFYCLWDDRASVQEFQTLDLTYGNRLTPVLAGLRNPGQRSLEIAVTGPASAAEAEAAVREELRTIVVVQN
jgi:exosortase